MSIIHCLLFLCFIWASPSTRPPPSSGKAAKFVQAKNINIVMLLYIACKNKYCLNQYSTTKVKLKKIIVSECHI